MFVGPGRVKFRLICLLCSIVDIYSEVHVTNFEDVWEPFYGKIIHTSVLFRHGDRSVIEPYPNDPHSELNWPDGLGQLLKVGKEHEYELGLWLRLRYEIFLEGGYNYDTILVDSSDVDRTLMSAELVLAAMFPPSEREMWNKFNFTWQPIPVHTVPVDQDYYIHQDVPCDRYDVEVSLVNSSPDLLAYYKEHEDIIKYVGKYSGFTMSSDDVVESFYHIDTVHDVLFIESLNDLPLPEWTHKVFPHPLRELSAFSFFLPSYTREMRRLKAGPLLGKILDDVRGKVNGNSNQTIHLYSGHDSTIANVLSALGQYNFLLPPYGSSLLFELREKGDDHFITLLYRNSSFLPPYLLNFTECGGACTVDQFVNFTANLIPSNYEAECNIGFFEKFIILHFPQIIVVFFVTVTVAVILFLYYLRKKRIRRYEHYQRVKNEVMKAPA